eukprot:1368404-Amorphochlora_amoeboformis.AAC.1
MYNKWFQSQRTPSPPTTNNRHPQYYPQAFDATPRNNDSPRIKKADVNSERPTTPISKPPITSISIPPITSISKPPRLDLDDRCKEDENHSEIEKRFSEVEWYKRRPRAPPSTPK